MVHKSLDVLEIFKNNDHYGIVAIYIPRRGPQTW